MNELRALSIDILYENTIVYGRMTWKMTIVSGFRWLRGQFVRGVTVITAILSTFWCFNSFFFMSLPKLSFKTAQYVDENARSVKRLSINFRPFYDI